MSKFKLSAVRLGILLVLPCLALGAKANTSTKPTVSGISPTGATAGGASFTLTVVGTNFVSGAVVTWSGPVSGSVSASVLSSTKLTAIIPSSLITTAGTAYVAVYVAGRSGGTSNSVAFTIVAATTTTTTTTTTSALTISTTSVPVGTVGTAYSATLSATGGTSPYSWKVSSGALPAGLSLSTTGAISGTPTTSGSYSFMATVTDSASHTSSYTYSTSIGASTTTALSISTASVPGGTAGTAYPSTTLAATGGTSPYTWTWAAASGSSLPAGLTLSTSGSISGTPTTAGTYNVTVTAKDSASNTTTKSYGLTVASSTSTGPLFTANFDSGSLGPWNSYGGVPSLPTLSTTTSYSSPGSGQAYFYMCGDSTNTACGSQVVSVPGFFETDFNSNNGYPSGLQSFYLRGFVLHHVQPDGMTTGDAGRKLFYLLSDPNFYSDGWAFVVTSFANSSGLQLTSVDEQPVAALQVGGYSGNTWYSQSYMQFDQWACVELYLKPNTPGLSDGAFTLWLNGNVATQATGLNLRGNATNGIQNFQIGRQVSRLTWATIDEYRYWDNIVISTTGPIGCSIPPLGLGS